MVISQKRLLTQLTVSAFFLAFVLIQFYPVIFSREKTFFFYGDNVQQIYPFMNKIASSLHKGYLPLWDANSFGGKSFPGDPQTAVFYPVNLLWCWIFGSINGIDFYYLDLLVVLHYLFALAGMYKLARVFQLSIPASIGTALVFSFTGVLATRASLEAHIFFSLTYMPWVVYFIARYYWQQPHKRYLIYAGVAGGLQILAGHMQPFFHTMIIALILAIYYEYQRRRNWSSFVLNLFRNFAIIGIFSSLLALPQIYYSARFLLRSYREVGGGPYPSLFVRSDQPAPLSTYLHRFVFRPTDLGNLLGGMPTINADYNSIYMGILPLFLTIILIFRGKLLQMAKPHLELKGIFILILILGILSILGSVTFIPYILHILPLFSWIRELARYAILINFSGAILLGLTLTHLEQLANQLYQPSLKPTFYLLVFLTLNAIYWIFVPLTEIPLTGAPAYLLAFIFLLILVRIRTGHGIKYIAVGFVALELLVQFNFNGPANTQYTPPQYWNKNKMYKTLEESYGQFRVDFQGTYLTLLPGNLGDIFRIQTKNGYCSAVNEDFYNYTHYSQTRELDDLLNIRYVLSSNLLDSGHILRDSIKALYLYERENYYPRCYWKHQLGLPGKMIEEQNKGNIQQLDYSDQYQQWAIDCQTPDTLIFSENDYPGWECYDNKKKISIYRPTLGPYPLLFRSVPLNRGRHIIEFKFRKAFYWF
jgi:hypothetical protein